MATIPKNKIQGIFITIKVLPKQSIEKLNFMHILKIPNLELEPGGI